ncbi:hypothetical protein BGZ63DRAFT_245176 [Mariannaea sp. PMI_226]|nr:hypothetical protein BGZ63DRAFT_245176 [Mariannaea sp. PMI_226]
MSSNIQVQWSLNSLANWDFVQRIVNAASTDNVQVQAIVACQEVGVNLAIGADIMRKVTQVMIPSPQPTPVKFIRASIGFSPNDSATQLATSLDGVRFLALAAALVPTIKPYASAQVLEILLKQTKLKLTATPPLPHLRDLFGALEARCHQCDFTAIISGYELLLGGILRTPIGETGTGHDFAFPSTEQQNVAKNPVLSGTPSPKSIAGLIDVFRQVARIGESTVTGVTIKIRGAAAWILAFVEWCLGFPASIYVEGHSEPILEQDVETFSIKAIILHPNNKATNTLEAIIHHHHIEDITRLLGSIDKKEIRFMVKIDDYISWLLEDHRFTQYNNKRFNTRMTRMLSEALSYAIPHILALKNDGIGSLCNKNTPARWVRSEVDSVEDLVISPLPPLEVIANVCAKFLKLKRETFRFSNLEGRHISDLPLVKAYLESLDKRCECKKCYQGPSQDKVRAYQCLRRGFFLSLAFIALDIIAYSLLDCPISLRVWKCRDRLRGMDIQKRIASILGPEEKDVRKSKSARGSEGQDESDGDSEREDESYGDSEQEDESNSGGEWEDESDGDRISENGTDKEVDSQIIEVMDIYDWARSLVGHAHIDDEDRSLIMTSAKGQVVYPLIFEALRVETHGYLRLCVRPGVLRYNNSLYDVVSCPETLEYPELMQTYTYPNLTRFGKVTEPKDLHPNFNVSWVAETQDNREIELYMVMKDSKKPSFTVKRNPFDLLHHLSSTLLLQDCSHPGHTKLSEDRDCRYAAPWHDHSNANNSHSSVDIIAIASSDLIRAFALCCTAEPKVLRRTACLECSLRVCWRMPNPIHVLIL